MIVAVAIAAAYFVLAYASLELSDGANGIVAVWPASGVLISGLLLTNRQTRPWIFMFVAIASLGANVAGDASLKIAAALTVANLIEGAIAAFLMRDRHHTLGQFAGIRIMGNFMLAGIVGVFWGATIAASASATPFAETFMSWFTTAMLGILIVVPLATIISQAITNNGNLILVKSSVTTLVMLMAFAVMTASVFVLRDYSLLFIPIIATVYVTYLLGPAGASSSVLITATIGSLATGNGMGPIAHAQGGQLSEIASLQFYLLVCIIAALPSATLLTARRRSAAEISRKNELLQMAERAAKVGHWTVDLVRSELQWSDEVYRIHQKPVGEPISFKEAIRCYHAGDRPTVRKALDHTLATGDPFEFKARLIQDNQVIGHVISRGEAEFDRDGQPIALFGMIQDITDTVRSLQQVELARKAAEHQAAKAKHLSETDQLTGIANRRKSLNFLERAIAKCQSSNAPLSVAVLDIDHFKSINDRHGHDIGDLVLIKIAKHCSNALRGQDCFGRLGGEEFILILPGASPSEARDIVERQRRGIEQLDFRPDMDAKITGSFGVVNYVDGMSPTDLIKSADRALYQAKADGRNLLRMAA